MSKINKNKNITNCIKITKKKLHKICGQHLIIQKAQKIFLFDHKHNIGHCLTWDRTPKKI